MATKLLHDTMESVVQNTMHISGNILFMYTTRSITSDSAQYNLYVAMTAISLFQNGLQI
jgi:hypothetical protein